MATVTDPGHVHNRAPYDDTDRIEVPTETILVAGATKGAVVLERKETASGNQPLVPVVAAARKH